MQHNGNYGWHKSYKNKVCVRINADIENIVYKLKRYKQNNINYINRKGLVGLSYFAVKHNPTQDIFHLTASSHRVNCSKGYIVT